MVTGRALLALCLVGSSLAAAGGVQWSYHAEPDKPDAVIMPLWAEIQGSQCGGQEQSPIDIDESQATLMKWDPLEFEGYDAETFQSMPPVYHFYNNGHTVGAKFIDFWRHGVTMSGGGLKAKYHPVAMHFHWGRSGWEGSEHTINGMACPAELHIVHVHEAYNGDAGAALASTRPERDDLAVLGIMLKEGEHNVALQRLFDSGMGMGSKYNGSKVEYTGPPNLRMIDELFPKNMKKYARYMGSLTTPMCQEKVAWTVMLEPIEASTAQLQELRSQYSKGTEGQEFSQIYTNYRDVQPMNGRTIWMCEGGMMEEEGYGGGDWVNQGGWGGAGAASLSLGALASALLASKLLL